MPKSKKAIIKKIATKKVVAKKVVAKKVAIKKITAKNTKGPVLSKVEGHVAQTARKGLTTRSTFSYMIKRNCVYVDKTEHMYNLFNGDVNYYFLSRPRRFGKSLLVSTLKELFSGNKKLFEDLWIESSDWKWEKHPVIHLDFLGIMHGSQEEFRKSLHTNLDIMIDINQLHPVPDYTPGDKFKYIITELAKQNTVVLLIDEYDKPIIDHITDLKTAQANRTILKGFYDVLKSLDEHLRAIFITGVSKFSRTSIFSGLNNLDDISGKPVAAALLGYTQQELEHYFPTYIADMAKKIDCSTQAVLAEMKEWYNGYRFSVEEEIRVYNPFSVLYYLKDKRCYNYWFESGTPTFLMKLLKERKEALGDFSGAQVTESELGPFELESIPLIPLLYQTGYLTILDVFKEDNTQMLRLGYPNAEVSESFSRCILHTLTQLSDGAVVSACAAIKKALIANNLAEVCRQMQILFANIPYDIHIAQEHYYHSLFQFAFNLMNLPAHSEISTSIGSIDMVITLPARILVIEFKFNKTVQQALKQIHKNRYYEKYLGQGKPITLAGINFCYQDKKLELEWVEEEFGATTRQITKPKETTCQKAKKR